MLVKKILLEISLQFYIQKFFSNFLKLYGMRKNIFSESDPSTKKVTPA